MGPINSPLTQTFRPWYLRQQSVCWDLNRVYPSRWVLSIHPLPRPLGLGTWDNSPSAGISIETNPFRWVLSAPTPATPCRSNTLGYPRPQSLGAIHNVYIVGGGSDPSALYDVSWLLGLFENPFRVFPLDCPSFTCEALLDPLYGSSFSDYQFCQTVISAFDNQCFKCLKNMCLCGPVCAPPFFFALQIWPCVQGFDLL